jgi:hypothetical protein
MQIGTSHDIGRSGGIQNTTSRSLTASIDISKSTIEDRRSGLSLSHTQIEGQISVMRRDGDSLRLTEIDFTFARTVLKDSLQDQLDDAFEGAGIDIDTDELLQGGVDFSPEATAERIVEFATSFFGLAAPAPAVAAPAAAIPTPEVMVPAETDKSTSLQDFTSLIRGAIEKGFAQARDFLEAFSPSDEVRADIDRTFELVIQGITSFAAERRAALEEEAADVAEAAEAEVASTDDNLALGIPGVLTARS